jgi:hypothetical protein
MRRPAAGEGQLEVRTMFEPNRLHKDSLKQAYERLLPVIKHPACVEQRTEARSLQLRGRPLRGGSRR